MTSFAVFWRALRGDLRGSGAERQYLLPASGTGTLRLPRDGGDGKLLDVLSASTPRDAHEAREAMPSAGYDPDADPDLACVSGDDDEDDYGGLRAPRLPPPEYQSLVEVPADVYHAAHGDLVDPANRRYRLEPAAVRMPAEDAAVDCANWSAEVSCCEFCLKALKNILRVKDKARRFPRPDFVAWLDLGTFPRDERGPLPPLTYLEWQCVAPASCRRQMLLLVPGGEAHAWPAGTERAPGTQRGLRGHVIATYNPDSEALASLTVPVSLAKLAERLTVRRALQPAG